MGKFSFIAGAGLGYLFGTRAGRAQYERIKKVGNAVWENPSVQSRVQKVEHKVGDLARERTAAVTDMVANTVKERIRGGGNGVKPAGTTGTPGTTGMSGTTGMGGPGDTGTTPPRPSEPIPPVS